MQTQNANWQQWCTFVLIGLLSLGFLFNVGDMRTTNVNDITLTSTADIDEEALAQSLSENLNVEVSVDEGEKISLIYNKILEEDLTDEKAKELVIDEVEDNDFEESIFDKLFISIESKTDIEDEDDITQIVVKDIDVTGIGKTRTVEVDAKVYYFIDGDKEETEKARITAIFEVTNLDVDEEYDDAKVELVSLTIDKVY